MGASFGRAPSGQDISRNYFHILVGYYLIHSEIKRVMSKVSIAHDVFRFMPSEKKLSSLFFFLTLSFFFFTLSFFFLTLSLNHREARSLHGDTNTSQERNLMTAFEIHQRKEVSKWRRVPTEDTEKSLARENLSRSITRHAGRRRGNMNVSFPVLHSRDV